MPELLEGFLVALLFVLPVVGFLRAQRRNQQPRELLFAATLGGFAAGLTILVAVWPQAPSLGAALWLLPYAVGATILGFLIGVTLLAARLFGAWVSGRR
jgi:hypothetical protein